MSRDGLVPKIFSQVHPKFRTPYRSNLLFMLFVSALAAFLPLQVVGEMTSIGTLFAFVIVCGGVWIMRRKQPDVPRPFRTPLVPVVAVLGMGWNFLMMYFLGSSNWTRLIVWLVIGQIFFFTYARNHSHLRKGARKGFSMIDRVLTAANIGFLAGGIIGFLTRAAGTGGTRLGFETVVERGINLSDPQLVALAKASYNGMMISALVGAAAGAAAGYAIHRVLRSDPRV
jgi:hypothetical protein